MLVFLLSGIVESLYIALFLIFAKNIKTYRTIFIISVMISYILLGIIFLGSIWFNITFIIALYCILKLLYRGGAGVLDLFIHMISCYIMTIVLILSIYAHFIGMDLIVSTIIFKILAIGFILIHRLNIRRFCLYYKSIWNRETNNTKIRSLTVRNISLILFNTLVIIFHFGTIFLFKAQRW